MARLGLVDQTEIARWAASREAQGNLPRLIRRLILETGRGVVQLGFPGGEGIASGSWDGTARATEATAFIPAGLSLWELSVEKDVNRKAERDYGKRIITPDGSPTEECTYVAVSLRRWMKRQEWAEQKSQKGRWKDVRGYGIDDIETWLESAPITHAWLSELLGFHPHGLVSAEMWWASWSGSTVVSFPAAAVLAGRKDEADNLCARLAGPGRITTVQGASYEDVFAFISAVALEDAEKGGSLLSRMALIDKVEAWRRLRDYSGTLILVPRAQEVVSDLGTGSAHHLIVPIVDGGTADITLGPVDSQAASKALAAVGLNERQAEEVGKLARLSLLAARRRIAQKPELHRPSWATAPVPRLQRRTLLLGRWDESSTGDISIVRQLLGMEYESISEELTALMLAQDPMFARFGSSIGLVSHFDAWLLVKNNLRKEDLEVFQSAAFTIFGELDPALDLPPDERYMASLRGKVRAHSGELRLGMATALALLGSRGDMLIAGSALAGQDWASWTVRKILESANKDDTCRLWISLRDVLTLFAEAAPATFLEAVRDGLQGEKPLLQGMFMDGKESGPLSTDSPHSDLLWALETCSWSPANFGQVVDLFARLSAIDPGGRLLNRPAACLLDIFRPSYPQASVAVERRLAVLDGLRKRHPSVAWSLMLSMLPDHGGGFALNMSAPRFRDWSPQEIVVTKREYWAQIEEVCQRLLEDVEADPVRWMSLLEKLPKLGPHLRVGLLGQLRNLSDDESLDEEVRDRIWKSLCTIVARHRKFRDADWALPADEIDRIADLGRRFQPSAPSKRFAWLFDEFMPDIPDFEQGTAGYDSMLSQLFAEAATEIVKSSTWSEIHRFAVSRKVPDQFGAALAQINMTMFDDHMLELLRTTDSAELQFALGYVSKRFQDKGWPWIERHLQDKELSPEQCARVLLVTRDFPKAWEIADAAGEEVATAFWRHFRATGRGSDFLYVETVARRLMQVGRLGGALHLLVLYRRQDDKNARADLMASCLEELLRCDLSNSDFGVLSHHDLVEAFSCLEQSSISIERLGRLEWAYLKVFDHDASPPTLSRYLALSPSFFVEVVSQIYRPRLPQEAEPKANSSYLAGE
jgi:hypothetical protein